MAQTRSGALTDHVRLNLGQSQETRPLCDQNGHNEFQRRIGIVRSGRLSSAMSATKAQSQKIFEKLRSKPANKVHLGLPLTAIDNETDLRSRYASTADQRTQHGRRSRLASTSVSTVRLITVISVSISLSFVRRTLTVGISALLYVANVDC